MQRRARLLPSCALALVSVLAWAGCGERIAPSDECTSYVACQQAYDEATGDEATDLSIYAAEGTCWDTEENADNCSLDCIAAYDALADSTAARGLALEECAPLTQE